MAKTIRTYYEATSRGKQARALVELDHQDLYKLDCLELRWGDDGKFVKDPAQQFEAVIAQELRAAATIVQEEGVVKVAMGALERLKKWVAAARQVKNGPLGIWMEEEPEPTKKPEGVGPDSI